MNVKPIIETTILSGDYELDKILSSIDLYHICLLYTSDAADE